MPGLHILKMLKPISLGHYLMAYVEMFLEIKKDLLITWKI